MSVRRSREQIDRLKRARSRAGRYVVVESGKVRGRRNVGRVVPKARIYVGTGSTKEVYEQVHQQPRPKVPLLSGSGDPTLGERFEEELYRP